ncbi:MAG TPA: hypothetical protein DCE65_02515 [Clostridiales bacterium]|nr:hypothetical protein [Clostridiales bacterium]
MPPFPLSSASALSGKSDGRKRTNKKQPTSFITLYNPAREAVSLFPGITDFQPQIGLSVFPHKKVTCHRVRIF